MKLKYGLLLFCLLQLFDMAKSQNYDAYAVFTSEGRSVKWEKVIKKVSDSDVILFGELHNDPIAHWLQLRLVKDLPGVLEGELIVGAEMFERDNQLILDEYLNGLIDEKRFESAARLWPNYKTDYKPALSFARDSGIRYIATNIPRRYANMVSKGGFEALDRLDEEAKSYIAPMPVHYDPDQPAYRNMLKMSMGHGKMNENFPKAQAIKDATMAHFILETLSDNSHFLHFNGAYHSDNHQGIAWYLKYYEPELSVKTISTVLQQDTGFLEEDNYGKADFIIVVPEDMTRTY